ncbi:3-hydroxyacyl-CoA dehydrogenase family protein [Massilia pseudoviolaceinigra]|uniref:3-hydroxyacyl-CoA dehydrogenase family protein n=1 Tax=Massilia pseudoviolaceinigra TaxID=3057165 RepID=UPI002796576B|nr:3-hydroxyacyl-CoA dehydrogenase family protein [Massilia sp. CCM 9206]MDQ1920913.1 3-hydroxyacyl-CoA dehydrogenase family protein [Massilia sp. CCM 9206]
MKYNKIGVIGAGVIGRGVAQSFAQTGHSVVLLDVSASILDDAKSDIARGLRLSSLTDPTLRGLNHAEILSRIGFTTDYAHLAETEFVVENVTENWDVKEAVYRSLDRICPEHCIFAVNTSAIPIARVAAITSRPASVIGIHFMNPVPKKQFVELITSEHTGADTVKVTLEILEQLGKKAIFVNDQPGFVSNRIMMLMINESIATLADGVATAEAVDSIFVNCFAHKMGPLATADLIGLDTILHTLDVLHDSYRSPKFEACSLLRDMVQSGRLGRKSGRGFFEYNNLTAGSNGH